VGYGLFAKAVAQLPEDVGKPFIDQIRAMIDTAYLQSMVMIASYSLDPDVLSQWRAYADDGRGFAIGFSAKQMQMPAKTLRVLYDEGDQLREITGNLMHTYKYEKSIGFRYDHEFQSHWFNVGLDLWAYKNPGFREEKEIRQVHVNGLAPEGDYRKIVSAGARSHDGKMLSEPIDVRFRSSGSVVVPYVALDYTNRGALSPVKEVVLGPRNENSVSNVQLFLNTIGVKGVIVRQSSVPYR
jgi:Protein of unknown function (DUF2971)